MKPRLEILASRVVFSAGVKLLPVLRLPDGGMAVMKEAAKMEGLEDGDIPPAHAHLDLDDAAAHKLMDQLWDAGVRPEGAAGSMGQLAAVKSHLEDMRRLVFREKA